MPPLTSNGLKLLWKRNNCRRHDINFIFIWYLCRNRSIVCIDKCPWYMNCCVWNCRAIFFSRLFFCLSIVSLYQQSRSALKSNKNKGNRAFYAWILSPNRESLSWHGRKAVYELCLKIFRKHSKYFIRLWKIERGLRKSDCAIGIFHSAYFICEFVFSVFVVSNIA